MKKKDYVFRVKFVNISLNKKYTLNLNSKSKLYVSHEVCPYYIYLIFPFLNSIENFLNFKFFYTNPFS